MQLFLLLLLALSISLVEMLDEVELSSSVVVALPSSHVMLSPGLFVLPSAAASRKHRNRCKFENLMVATFYHVDGEVVYYYLSREGTTRIHRQL